MTEGQQILTTCFALVLSLCLQPMGYYAFKGAWRILSGVAEGFHRNPKNPPLAVCLILASVLVMVGASCIFVLALTLHGITKIKP